MAEKKRDILLAVFFTSLSIWFETINVWLNGMGRTVIIIKMLTGVPAELAKINDTPFTERKVV